MKNPADLNQARSLMTAMFSLLFIVIALTIPNRIVDITPSSFLHFPLEIIFPGFLLWVPGRCGWLIRWVLAALLALGVILKCADMMTYHIFARPFNPVFDFYLFADGMNVLRGSLGAAGAWVIAVLLVVAVLIIIFASFLLLGNVQRLRRRWSFKSTVWVSVVLVSVLSLALVYAYRDGQRDGMPGLDTRVASFGFYQHLSRHGREVLATLKDNKEFNRQLATADSLGGIDLERAEENLFSRLRGKNVLVIFVESYGRTLVDNPEFAPQIHSKLIQANDQLTQNGFSIRSGFLTSPTVGGLSWLAHGTAMSGLWIDNEIRYKNLMMSERPTLNRLFQKAGWRTLAVMPAITMDWPEGNYYGYDHIYNAHNLGYEGKSFGWVTMPDQYTLHAFQQRELEIKTRRPFMAEIALISSHAPWTPIPKLLDWKTLGTGAEFNRQAEGATGKNSPEEIWKDTARIRLQFRLSIEYALDTITSYLLTYGDDDWVVLMLGDHQPAPLVTGDTRNRDVPVHLIARDPEVMAAVAHWRWSENLLPEEDAPVWPMDQLRNRFIEAFSSPAD